MITPEPDYEAPLGLIKHLSTDQLKELVNDENKILEVVNDLPQIKNLCNEKEMLLTANKSLAEYNLSFEPKLSEGRQELISKYEEQALLDKEIKNLKSNSEQSAVKHTPDEIRALLKTAAYEKEEETENLVKSLLDNNCSVEDFLTEFVDKRCIAHSRRIKAEKITELLNHNYNTPSLVSTPFATRYPTTLPNMPMPTYSMK